MRMDQLIQEFNALNDLRSNREDLARALGRIGRIVVDAGHRGGSPEGWISLIRIVEEILEHFRELLILDQLPRKVYLTKSAGEKPGKISIGNELAGWEVGRPTLGEPYYVLLLDGRILRTSRVQEVGEDHVRTENSVYEMQVVRESLCLADLLKDLSGDSQETEIGAPSREKNLLKIVK
jgi:hypothetical protein